MKMGRIWGSFKLIMRFTFNIVMLLLLMGINWTLTAGVRYELSPNLDGAQAQISVKLTIEADNDGLATLVYFDEAWGEKNLFDCLYSIKVLNKDARLRSVPEQNRVYVKANPGEVLDIVYVIVQDFEGDAQVEEYYRPIINKDYFHLFGHRLFLIPESVYYAEQKSEIGIEWKDSEYLVQHNFGKGVKGIFELNKDELLESVVVGGDFRRQSLRIDGIQLQLLTRGEWRNFNDDELMGKLASIISVQRKFWNDYTDDVYTVTLLPLNAESGAYIGGTGLSKGFASYCSNSRKSNLQKLTSLYYHEIMHHWIGGKIRNSTLSEELWFSEGFTEYFAHGLMLEEGEITKKEFKRIVDTFKNKLAQSKFSNIDNNSLALNSEFEELPYQRGFLYAYYLEEKLQQETEYELKDLMIQILKESSEKNFSNHYFEGILDQFLSKDEVALFQKYILNGELIPE